MLKKYQGETITHEQEEQNKAKEKIKEEMKDELDQIKKKATKGKITLSF